MKQEQQFVYTRTYSRWLDDQKRRETYPETVSRYMDYMADKLEISKYFYNIGHQAILNMDVMPSMRAMWAAGPAADAENIAIYNCSYLPIDSLRSFSEVLYILMCGTGVGFSIEASNVNKLPAVAKVNNAAAGTVLVEDSKQGWAEAFDKFLQSAVLEGLYLIPDVTNVRKRGERLKTMGGRSSGPEPLIDLFNFTRVKLMSRAGQRLRPIDCLDILNKVADIVVVGGVRRSSQISLSDLSDSDVANAKSGEFWITNPQRSMSNNSVVYSGQPQFNEFLDEFIALIKSGTGERGIFNREAAQAWARYSGRRNPDYEFGCNPCLAPETLVQTKQGHFQIKDLVGQVVDVWDGNQWVTIDNFRITGENQEVLKVTLQDGSFVRITPYHRCIDENGESILAKDLIPGETKLLISSAPESHGTIDLKAAYLKGFLLGDGTIDGNNNPLLWLYDTKYVCKDRLKRSANELDVLHVNTNAVEKVDFAQSSYNRERMTGLVVRNNRDPFNQDSLYKWSKDYKVSLPKWVFTLTKESKLELLAGIFDADGTALDTKNGFGYQLSSVNQQFLLDVQYLLKTIGVYSKVSLNRKAGVKDFNDGYGEYKTKDLYRLVIAQNSAIDLSKEINFSRLMSFKDRTTKYKLKPRRNLVVSVEPDGVEEFVYCCTVHTNNSFTFNGLQWGQCGEINLRPYEYCNLSEVVARSTDTLEQLKQKIKVATMFGCWQSTFTDFNYINPQWAKNCEEERLLGVSITGVMDHPVLGVVTPKSNKWWGELKAEAITEAERWAKRLNINMPAAITCIKPSGTVSQLVDSASGMHPRHSQFYIRRYRISTTDPLFRMLVDQGVQWSPENGQYADNCTTAVLSFPVAAPPKAKTRHDITALDQLKHWEMVKHFYTEHNPSITVYVSQDEWFDVASWVWKNLDSIGGISFLPKTDHIYQQAPYEDIDEARYKELKAAMPEIDYTKLSDYEVADNTEGARSYNCTGDKCELT